MAEDNTEKQQGFQAYHDYVNIGLYNDIVAFVMATTAADTMPVLRSLKPNHLWYRESHNNNIQVQYGFRYLGELLERYEDKAGSDIRDMRAIALAIADTRDLFTDDMFVGNQKNNFIKKITRLSVGDIYLKGALYLLKKDDSNASGLFDVLTRATYTKTEELIFVMSLYDDFEQAFQNLKPKLIYLLGKAKTIMVAGNIYIFCWIIKKLCRCPKIKQIRTKDMTLIRALMEFPVSFVKKDSRPYNVLLNNGFTEEEIIYLNSFIVCQQPISTAIHVHSIVAEKIAVEMCKTFINSENTHSPCVYEHLEWLLKTYYEFQIKISGYRGIYYAIKDSIKLINAKTFLWLYKTIKPKDVFRFDILDERWDILSCELEAGVYRKFFDEQLVENPELTGTQIIERIEKYDTLTGTSYLAQFEQEYMYDRNNVFKLLVQKGNINLETSFASCPDIDSITENDRGEEKPPMLQYIGHSIKGIHSREAFDFLKYFFSKYNFNDMHRLFTDRNRWGSSYRDSFFLDEFYKGPIRYQNDRGQRFAIKRQFLSDDEHRELFDWLDDYMFQYKADEYIEFAVLLLADSFVRSLFPHDELRKIYDTVRHENNDTLKKYRNDLKNIYSTEDELQAESDEAEIRKKEQQRQHHEQQLIKLRNELITGYDGTFKSLLEYLEKHKYGFYNRDDAFPIAVEYLGIAFSDKNHVFTRQEIGRFLIFSGKLMEEGFVDFNTIKNHVSLVKEEIIHDENNTAVEFTLDD